MTRRPEPSKKKKGDGANETHVPGVTGKTDFLQKAIEQARERDRNRPK